jgi:hypothetical protein
VSFQVWFRSGNGLSTSSFGVCRIPERLSTPFWASLATAQSPPCSNQRTRCPCRPNVRCPGPAGQVETTGAISHALEKAEQAKGGRHPPRPPVDRNTGARATWQGCLLSSLFTAGRRRIRAIDRGGEREKQPTQNTAARKRERQEGKHSDYLFGSFLQLSAFRSTPAREILRRSFHS